MRTALTRHELIEIESDMYCICLGRHILIAFLNDFNTHNCLPLEIPVVKGVNFSKFECPKNDIEE